MWSSEQPNRGTGKGKQKRYFAFDKLQMLQKKPAHHCSFNAISYFFTTSLVMRAGAFYNPSNTALKTVVSFNGHHGAQSPEKAGGQTVSECIHIDLHFGSFQEY
jgi:hypothetical protein